MTDAREQLGAAFKAVMIAMRQMRGRQARRHNGLSYAQYGLLFSLGEGQAMSARDLGEAASLSPASVTQMLDHLEAGGLVARKRSSEDKRVVMTELTERGQQAIAEMKARTEPAWRAALAEFSDEQLLTAAAVLDRLAEHFARLDDAHDDAEAARGSSDALRVGGDQLA